MEKTTKIIIALLGTAALVACQPKQGNAGKENAGDVDQAPMAVLVDTPKITTPPDSLKLDKFYKKYMKLSRSHILLHKISQERVAGLQSEQIRQIFGDQHFVGRFAGNEFRQSSRFQIIFEESPVIAAVHTFQHDPLKIGVRFQNTRFGCKRLHMK